MKRLLVILNPVARASVLLGCNMRWITGLSVLIPAVLGASLIAAAPAALAQSPLAQSPGRQITSAVDESSRTTLAGNTRPEVRAKKNDRGAVPDNLAMAHMQLLLRRSPAQEQALEQLIDQLQN